MNKRQQLFCDEYLKDFNGARAYREIYNCSEENARKNANKLITTNRDVRDYIERESQKIHNEKIADVEEIRQLLTEIARGQTEKRDNDGY